MSNRATSVEKESRVMLFADAIASGFAKRSDLLSIANENDWGVSDDQVDNYIREAREVFKERAVSDLDTTRRKRIKQLEHLAHVNYLKGDYTEVRHNIKLLADIEGIVVSRFADKGEEKSEGMAIVSRFADNWKKAGGE